MTSRARNSPRKIIGIDPGSIALGYGIITTDGRNASYVASGVVSPPSGAPLPDRLRCIYQTLTEIVRSHRPDDMVVEKIFFAKGVKSALNLGHARGIVLLAGASENVPIHECTALQVKKAVVGYGRAEKSQVQEMVKLILGIKGSLYPDSADALALALCYMNALKFNESVKGR